ncbi:uncharacterized protein O3C94_022862 [Discoglossus pictus]
MAETAPAPPPAATESEKAPAKKKQTKKAAAGAAKKSRPAKAGPSVSELIVKAVSASKERSGLSLAALKKALAAGGYDVQKNNSRIKLAIKALVTKETLIQVKGSGASGSFKLNKKQLESKEKKAAAAAKKKEAASKPKKAAPKKPAAAKSPKKPKKAPAGVKKSPKKAKKPAAAAKKTAAKSPKKPKAAAKPAKKPAKSPAKKATKSPAKKAAKPKADGLDAPCRRAGKVSGPPPSRGGLAAATAKLTVPDGLTPGFWNGSCCAGLRPTTGKESITPMSVDEEAGGVTEEHNSTATAPSSDPATPTGVGTASADCDGFCIMLSVGNPVIDKLAGTPTGN